MKFLKKALNKVWEGIVCSPVGMLLMLPMLYDSYGATDNMDDLAAKSGIKRQKAQEPTTTVDKLETIEYKDSDNNS